MINVPVLTNIPSPYRIGLWKEISKSIDVEILYTDKTEKIRKWKMNFGKDYRNVLLHKIKYCDMEFSFQLFREILNNKNIKFVEFLVNKRMIREYGQNSYKMIKSNAHKVVVERYIDVIKGM